MIRNPYLRVSSTDPQIGVPAAEIIQEPRTVEERLEYLENLVPKLLASIAELESRTWLSMLWDSFVRTWRRIR